MHCLLDNIKPTDILLPTTQENAPATASKPKMSSKIIIDDKMYNQCLKDLWSVPFQVDNWFPKEIGKWIKHQATVLGVPLSYVAIPLLVGASHCSQHTDITIGHKDIHKEPALLYGIVAGRSGNIKFYSTYIRH